MKIRIFDWDTLYASEFPNNSESLPLSQNDIQKIDSILTAEAHRYNNTQGIPFLKSLSMVVLDSEDFTINLQNYRRQYFPYKDVNGEATVLSYCFRKLYPSWKSTPRGFRPGDRGTQYFFLKINLTKNSCDGISTAGYL